MSCQKVTELIEKQFLTTLSLMERFQLSVHLKMCENCRAYKDQSKLIDSMLQKPEFKELKLSDDAKQKIIDQLEK